MSATQQQHIEAAHQRTTERPILFTPDMVRAILEGRKTQTRRIIKHENLQAFPDQWKAMHQAGGGNWVAWSINSPAAAEFTKKAYPGEGIPCPYGQPGDHLAAARLLLEITDIRAQRLHEITEAEAIAEGIKAARDFEASAKFRFSNLWEKIYGPGAWEQNPWVWAITFQKITP